MLKVSRILNAGVIKGSDGKPLRLYHGTKSVFDKFEGVSYFSDDPNEAAGYALAGNKLQNAIWMRKKYQFVKPEGLKIPEEFSYDEAWPVISDYEGPDNVVYAVEDGLAYRVKNRYFILENRRLNYVQADWKVYVVPGTSGLETYYRQEIKEFEDKAEQESPSIHPVYLTMNKPYVSDDYLWGNQFARRWSAEYQAKAENVLQKLKEQGYDGIIVPSDSAAMANMLGEGPGHEVMNYVVFDNSQIHSAIQPLKVSRILTAGYQGGWFLPDGKVIPIDPGDEGHADAANRYLKNNKMNLSVTAGIYDDLFEMGWIRFFSFQKFFEIGTTQKNLTTAMIQKIQDWLNLKDIVKHSVDLDIEDTGEYLVISWADFMRARKLIDLKRANSSVAV